MGKTKKIKGTKTQLEYVEKDFKWHVKPVKCLNQKQKEFVKSIKEKEVTICSGPAGCGKTFLALWEGLRLLEKKQFEQIVLIKSVTPVQGEDLGFLPGGIESKTEPFLYSFYGNADKIIGEETRKYLINSKKLVVQPLMYARGINIDNSLVIIDEVQNLSLDIFKTIITRIGKNSKYIIMGDASQTDLKNKAKSCLLKILELFKDDDLIGTVSFNNEDCVRNPIIPHLLNKLQELEQQKES